MTERFYNSMLSQKPLLLMIICAHCPFVKHVEKQLSKIEKDYLDKIQLLAISSNSLKTHPQDGPEQLAAQAQKMGWQFPYLLDSDQSFAKSLNAACTPDFFVFSYSLEGFHKLSYRGQLDSSRPGNNVEVSGEDLRQALDSILQGNAVHIEQKPSIGCNIKWHPGEEPSWFGG